MGVPVELLKAANVTEPTVFDRVLKTFVTNALAGSPCPLAVAGCVWERCFNAFHCRLHSHCVPWFMCAACHAQVSRCLRFQRL